MNNGEAPMSATAILIAVMSFVAVLVLRQGSITPLSGETIIIAILSLLITVLIGWQVFSIINLDKFVKKQVDEAKMEMEQQISEKINSYSKDFIHEIWKSQSRILILWGNLCLSLAKATFQKGDRDDCIHHLNEAVESGFECLVYTQRTRRFTSDDAKEGVGLLTSCFNFSINNQIHLTVPDGFLVKKLSDLGEIEEFLHISEIITKYINERNKQL